jgi:hypothetical protein
MEGTTISMKARSTALPYGRFRLGSSLTPYHTSTPTTKNNLPLNTRVKTRCRDRAPEQSHQLTFDSIADACIIQYNRTRTHRGVFEIVTDTDFSLITPQSMA